MTLEVVTGLFSYDDSKRKRIFDQYYLPNATFTSPILRTNGVHNIKQYVQRTFFFFRITYPSTVFY
jgi:hypothetical protein